MAKIIMLFVLLLSVAAQADTAYYCVDNNNPRLSYELKGAGDYPSSFTLTVKKSDLATGSCQTRWGCDDIDTVIAQDKLEFTDVQGVYVFESKRTTIEMESLEEVSYSYTYKTRSGEFKSGRSTLTCQEN